MMELRVLRRSTFLVNNCVILHPHPSAYEKHYEVPIIPSVFYLVPGPP